MKKLAKLAVLATALVTVLSFTACNNAVSGDNTVSGSYSANRKTINLVAYSEDELINFGGSEARTIMPDAVDGSALDFYLLTKNNTTGATTYTLSDKLVFNADKTLTSDSYSTGTITQVFDLADYDFILYGINTADNAYSAKSPTLSASNIGTYAQYVAYANADLRYYDTIRFQLKVNTLSSGKGQVKLTVKHQNDWAIPGCYRVLTSICKIDGEDTIVYPSTTANTIYGATLVGDPGTLGAAGVAAFTAQPVEVPIGEYNFIINYCKYDSVGASTPSANYYYTEKIIVLLNQTTEATIEVPEILEKAPEAPSLLIVGYNIPENTDTPYYPVHFTWKDNADNESEYVLELKEINNTTFPLKPDDDTKWGKISATNTGLGTITLDKLGYQASELNPGLNETVLDAALNETIGSLNKNSTNVTILLPLESRFIARLCAKNDAGQSAYVYPKYALTDTDGTNTTQMKNTNWLEFESDVETINLFKITYDLNGGEFVNADATGSTISTPPVLIHYASQRTDSGATPVGASSTDIAIINPDGVTTNSYYTDVKGKTPIGVAAAITLSNNGLFWSKWVKNNESTGSDYSQSATYAAETNYIKNIKYYPYNYDGSAVSNQLGSQPTKAADLPTAAGTEYFVRHVTVDPYTDYKNLYLVAKYDSSKILYIEADNMAMFEMTPDMIAVAYSKGGTALSGTANVDSKDSITADDIKDLDLVKTNFKNLITVSQTKVDKVSFTLTGDFTTTSYDEATNTITTTANVNYDKAHLIVTRVRDNNTLVDSDWDSTKWDVSIKTWTPGKYTLLFTSNISEQPKTTYSYTCALEITQ